MRPESYAHVSRETGVVVVVLNTWKWQSAWSNLPSHKSPLRFSCTSSGRINICFIGSPIMPHYRRHLEWFCSKKTNGQPLRSQFLLSRFIAQQYLIKFVFNFWLFRKEHAVWNVVCAKIQIYTPVIFGNKIMGWAFSPLKYFNVFFGLLTHSSFARSEQFCSNLKKGGFWMLLNDDGGISLPNFGFLEGLHAFAVAKLHCDIIF